MHGEADVIPINHDAAEFLRIASGDGPAEHPLEAEQRIMGHKSVALGALNRLVAYLNHPDDSIRAEASRAISDVAEVTTMRPLNQTP